MYIYIYIYIYMRINPKKSSCIRFGARFGVECSGRWRGADATGDRRRRVRRRLCVICRRRHRPALPEFGQHFATLSAIDLHMHPWKSCWLNDNTHISRLLVYSAKICPTFFDLYESIIIR